MAQVPPGSSRLTTHQLSNPCRKIKLIWSRLDQKLRPETIIQPTKSHGPRVGEGWSPKGKSGYCHQRRQKSHLLWTVRICMTVQDPDVSVTGTTRSCITFSVPQTLWQFGGKVTRAHKGVFSSAVLAGALKCWPLLSPSQLGGKEILSRHTTFGLIDPKISNSFLCSHHKPSAKKQPSGRKNLDRGERG